MFSSRQTKFIALAIVLAILFIAGVIANLLTGFITKPVLMVAETVFFVGGAYLLYKTRGKRNQATPQ